MQLRTLQLDKLMEAVRHVNRELNDDAASAALLDSAREDTPVIGELLQQIALLHGMPDGPKKQRGLTAAERDLTLLLALRHLEHAERATGS